MTNRSATSALFGFDFQTNAAIVLMLENIKDLSTIRLEGREDIEIELNNESYILAQAKAVVNSSTDFTNVLRNLKKSIESLSDAGKDCPCVKQFIYITNSPNPFKEKQLNSIFYGMAQRDYNSLPQELKKKITSIVARISNPIDVERFKIQILPFETENDKERYKCVMDSIREFLATASAPHIAQQLHLIWKDELFKSGTRNNQDIKLTKDDIIWPLIVLITNNDNYDDENLDESEVEEINRLYSGIINTCSEKYEFVTKVLCAYNDFQKGEKKKDKVKNFIEQKCQNYSFIFEGTDLSIESGSKELLLKIILRNILHKRIQIEKIKTVVNL